jgi:rhodanese-related sulfurtransferase
MTSAPTVTTISPADFHRVRDSAGPHPLLIDVRTPAEFASGHLPGARNLPLSDLNPSDVAASRTTPADPVYVICQSGQWAATACVRLTAAGVAPVISIDGGTAAWQRAGFPTQSDATSGGASCPLSLEQQVRAIAGSLVLLGSALAFFLHPSFLALPAFVGAGLLFAGLTNRCGMAMLLLKMPWNRS